MPTADAGGAFDVLESLFQSGHGLGATLALAGRSWLGLRSSASAVIAKVEALVRCHGHTNYLVAKASYPSRKTACGRCPLFISSQVSAALFHRWVYGVSYDLMCFHSACARKSRAHFQKSPISNYLVFIPTLAHPTRFDPVTSAIRGQRFDVIARCPFQLQYESGILKRVGPVPFTGRNRRSHDVRAEALFPSHTIAFNFGSQLRSTG